MARRRLFLTDQLPFHVVARTKDRQCFEQSLEQIWVSIAPLLYFMTLSFNVRIHAFVLMSNHFHMLVSASESNVAPAVEYLISNINQAVSKKETEPLFDGSYQATMIKSRVYYEHAYKYVYRNPVEAKMCDRVEDYRYSTLRGILGFGPLTFPVIDNMSAIPDAQGHLNWLNSPFPSADFLEELREAMKRPEFNFESDTHFSN